MVRALRANPHLLQSKTDFPAYILSFVVGGNIHISCFVIGSFGGTALFVKLE